MVIWLLNLWVYFWGNLRLFQSDFLATDFDKRSEPDHSPHWKAPNFFSSILFHRLGHGKLLRTRKGQGLRRQVRRHRPGALLQETQARTRHQPAQLHLHLQDQAQPGERRRHPRRQNQERLHEAVRPPDPLANHRGNLRGNFLNCKSCLWLKLYSSYKFQNSLYM